MTNGGSLFGLSGKLGLLGSAHLLGSVLPFLPLLPGGLLSCGKTGLDNKYRMRFM